MQSNATMIVIKWWVEVQAQLARLPELNKTLTNPTVIIMEMIEGVAQLRHM